MCNQEVKTNLQKYQRAAFAIRCRQEQLEELERQGAYCYNFSRHRGGPEFYESRSLPGSGSHGDGMDGVITYLDRLAALRTEIISEITAYEEEKKQLLEKIESLEDDRFVKILYYKYISGLTLSRIAEKLGYTEIHTKRLHVQALEAFAERWAA